MKFTVLFATFALLGVSANELADCKAKLIQASKTFKSVDTNEDGVISWEEYLEAFNEANKD